LWVNTQYLTLAEALSKQEIPPPAPAAKFESKMHLSMVGPEEFVQKIAPPKYCG
jgi:hypothetical protein